MDLILTGRKVPAEEAYRIGLCEKIVPHGAAREAAEIMAQEIARFPQECVRADRLSAYRAWGKSVREGLESEWATSAGIVKAEGPEPAPGGRWALSLARKWPIRRRRTNMEGGRFGRLPNRADRHFDEGQGAT